MGSISLSRAPYIGAGSLNHSHRITREVPFFIYFRKGQYICHTLEVEIHTYMYQKEVLEKQS